MPLYEFYCEQCQIIKEVSQSIHKKLKIPKCQSCKNKMSQSFGGNFILKGDWPGKSLKSLEYNSAKAREEDDQKMIEDKRHQRVVDETMAIRRKGKRAKRKLIEENPQQWRDYMEATKKGYKPSKDKKSKTGN